MYVNVQAMRLFVGDPVWTPFNRPHDHLPARYVSAITVYIDILSLFFWVNIWPLEFQEALLVLPRELCCRKEYIQGFLEKEAGDRPIDATAWVFIYCEIVVKVILLANKEPILVCSIVLCMAPLDCLYCLFCLCTKLLLGRHQYKYDIWYDSRLTYWI